MKKKKNMSIIKRSGTLLVLLLVERVNLLAIRFLYDRYIPKNSIKKGIV